MSGTPIRDNPREIAPLMNIILPLNQQLPVGPNFDRQFLTSEMLIKSNRKLDLINIFQAKHSCALHEMIKF